MWLVWIVRMAGSSWCQRRSRVSCPVRMGHLFSRMWLKRELTGRTSHHRSRRLSCGRKSSHGTKKNSAALILRERILRGIGFFRKCQEARKWVKSRTNHNTFEYTTSSYIFIQFLTSYSRNTCIDYSPNLSQSKETKHSKK